MKTLISSPLRYLLLVLMRLQSSKTSDQGFIIFFVSSVIVLLSLIWVAYGLLNRIDTSSTAASLRSNSGFYAAEYGLNLRAKEIRDTFEGFNRPTGTSPANIQACVNNSGIGSGDFICRRTDFQDPLAPRDTTARNTVYTFVQDRTVLTNGVPSSTVIPQGDPFAGLTAQIYRYDVISVAQDLQNQPTASLKITFRNLLIPLFQFAVFSENDADFSLPPTMRLNGPVHSNNSLYLNASSGSMLDINGQVTVADTLYRGLKYQNTGCSGTVNISSSGTAVVPVALGCGSGGTRQDYPSLASVSAWNNQIQVPVAPLQVPPPDALDPTPGSLYWDRADLRIVLRVQNNANSVSGFIPTGIEVRNPDNSNNSTLTNILQACTPVFGITSSGAAVGTTTLALNSPLVAPIPAGFNGNLPLLVGTNFDSLVAINPTSPTIAIGKQLTTSLGSNLEVRKAILWSSDTFFNYREKTDSTGNYILGSPNSGRYIRMLNVDMQELINCANSQGLMGARALDDTTDGGLVWFFTVEGPNARNDVTATPPQPANNYGIRLYNGSELRSSNGGPTLRGLTVVSDQAVYIQGDYNSTNKIPAAVLADTINILSNNWKLDDSNSGRIVNGIPDDPNIAANVSGAMVRRPAQCMESLLSLAGIGCSNLSGFTPMRIASETTINAAFLSGLDIPGGANGAATQNNGITASGVHNYPRFHENWAVYPRTTTPPALIPLNYRGSLVALNVPRRVNSPFCGSLSTVPACNIYDPPRRNWDFDTDFNNASLLPPLTPRAVFLKQDAFTRTFDISAISSDRIAGLFSPTRWLGFSLGLTPPQF